MLRYAPRHPLAGRKGAHHERYCQFQLHRLRSVLSASVRRSLRSETTDWLSPFRRSLRPWRRPPPRPGNPACQCHRPGVSTSAPFPSGSGPSAVRRGSVVCSPCCIFPNGHGCQFFRRPWLFLFPASVAWDAVSRQSVYAGTTAAGVDRTSIGRGPTHTTYPLGDILTAGVWGKFSSLRQPSASAVVRKRT